MKCVALQRFAEANEVERLRSSESLLNLLIDCLPMFISYIDSEQRYVLANAIYAEFFGRELKKIIGHRVNEVLGERAYQNVRTHIEAAMRGQRQSYEYTLSHADRTRHLRAIYIPHVENGKVRGIFVLGIDITELKRLEQLANEAKAK